MVDFGYEEASVKLCGGPALRVSVEPTWLITDTSSIQAASQPARQAASNPGSHPGSQAASQAASQEAT